MHGHTRRHAPVHTRNNMITRWRIHTGLQHLLITPLCVRLRDLSIVCACLWESAAGWHKDRLRNVNRGIKRKEWREIRGENGLCTGWRWIITPFLSLPCCVASSQPRKRTVARGNKLLRPPCDGGKFTTSVTGIVFLQVTAPCDLHHHRPMNCQHKAALAWHTWSRPHRDKQPHSHAPWLFGDAAVSHQQLLLWL